MSTDIATALYGASAAPVETAAPTPTESEVKAQAIADVLYAEPEPVAKVAVPDAIRTLRAAEEPGLYDRTTGLESVPFEQAMKDLPEPDDVKAATAAEYRHMAADVGASPTDTSQFLSIVQGLVSAPPTAEAAQRMQVEARTAVTAAYGDEAPALLALAQRMVARDPRLQSILERSGAGNDQRVVLMSIELARQQRAQGRLK